MKILSGVDAEACPPGSDAHARLAQLVSLLCNPATPVASFFVQAKTMQTQVLMGAGRGGGIIFEGEAWSYPVLHCVLTPCAAPCQACKIYGLQLTINYNNLDSDPLLRTWS